jgi:hypothetical protein
MATNAQIQQYVNERTRVRAEQIRALVNSLNDDIAAIDDVYAELNGAHDWEDTRTDGPPHLLIGSDVLGIHSFNVAIRDAMEAHGQYPVVLKACVRPVGG